MLKEVSKVFISFQKKCNPAGVVTTRRVPLKIPVA
jgi:hypothetical protein